MDQQKPANDMAVVCESVMKIFINTAWLATEIHELCLEKRVPGPKINDHSQMGQIKTPSP